MMFRLVVLFVLLAVAAAVPTKEEKAHIVSIKSESKGESSQWRKDSIEKHEEPVELKHEKHDEHHEEHIVDHHEEHHGEHYEDHQEKHHGDHHEEHHGEHHEEHHEKHHEEHKPEIKKKEIITYKSESEGESKQWRKDNIEKHVEHGHH